VSDRTFVVRWQDRRKMQGYTVGEEQGISTMMPVLETKSLSYSVVY